MKKRPINPEVVRLQSLMFAHRLKVTKVLERAQINRTTWPRWVDGAEPKMSTIKAVDEAISQLIAESTDDNATS